MIHSMPELLMTCIGKQIERGHTSGMFAEKSGPVPRFLSTLALGAHHPGNGITSGWMLRKQGAKDRSGESGSDLLAAEGICV